MIKYNSKIFVAGHNGLVGSAIVRKLKLKGYNNILIVSKKKLDLTNQLNVYKFLKRNKPKFIFIAAAKVGGIYSNNKYTNPNNVIWIIHQNCEISNILRVPEVL